MPNDAEMIAGYQLLDDGAPFPGGTVFRTTRPGSNVPALLKRYRAEWFAPADSMDGFHEKARAALGLSHPNLVSVLDAGFVGSNVFAVVEVFDSANLEQLVEEMGAMPGTLAAEFARQAARGLQAVHDRGLIHGDVRPANLIVTPLVDAGKTRADGSPLQAPAPDAVVKLADTGLVPKRPGGKEWAALDPLSGKTLAYLPPERVTDGSITRASDIYGLGASLFYLLAARAPYKANAAAEVIQAIESNPPAPLAALRPDLPGPFVELVQRLIAKDPAARPGSAAEVARLLEPYAEPPPVPLAEAPPENAPPEAANDWAGFGAESHTEEEPASTGEAKPAVRGKATLTDEERKKLKLWLYGGIGFWFIIAPIMWFAICNAKGKSKDKNDNPGRRY